MPKGRPYRSRGGTFSTRNLAITAIVFANLLVGTLLYQAWRSRLQHNPESQMVHLSAERRVLMKRMEQWNEKVQTSLVASRLEPIQITGVATHGVVSLSNSAGSGEGQCDPPDPNPIYRMRPKEEVAKEFPELAEKLRQHSKNNEIMLALANGVMICQNKTTCWWGGGNILGSFLTILDHANITNYLIGVMDDEAEAYLKAREKPVNWFRVNIKVPEVQKKSHPANQVSVIKYTLLKTFLQLGYNTLISDMDLVYVQNPFDHLHRDADVEIQSDGFDETAYGLTDGIRDPSMGWGGGGLFLRTFTTNVGCMWAKSNARTFKLMVQVSDHLAAHPGWDQQIFNDYLMHPAHGDHLFSFAHLRVMDIDHWVNSKIFFKSRREQYLPGAKSTAPKPVLVHFNYHSNKHERMLCVMDRYLFGNVSACDHMPIKS